ncbi:DUF6907 domain-containing protein [Streptomyces chartreusis]|uniref:DUF6907 domain-containing protein n=1 Tax=Streptomyces chartreusis TaxID=1969 RepID=UPI0038164BA1
MSSEPTITLATSDHGNVTLPEPSWCQGHSHHDPLTERADLIHTGTPVDLSFLGAELFSAQLVQSPFARPGLHRYGGRIEGVSVHPIGRTLNPTQLYDIAARLDAYADHLRELANQLGAILAGGER